MHTLAARERVHDPKKNVSQVRSVFQAGRRAAKPVPSEKVQGFGGLFCPAGLRVMVFSEGAELPAGRAP